MAQLKHLLPALLTTPIPQTCPQYCSKNSISLNNTESTLLARISEVMQNTVKRGLIRLQKQIY